MPPIPPSSVPATNDCPTAAQRHAPQRPPVTTRAINGAGAVRFGIIGSLSAINPPIGGTERSRAPPRCTKEGARGAVQIQPTEAGPPGPDRGPGPRPQPGHNSDSKS